MIHDPQSLKKEKNCTRKKASLFCDAELLMTALATTKFGISHQIKKLKK